MHNDPFLNILPTLDVHGYSADMVIVPVDEFINDNIKLGKDKIVIIHGKGLGVLKQKINTHFKRDKRVKRIYVYGSNLALTIIELNLTR